MNRITVLLGDAKNHQARHLAQTYSWGRMFVRRPPNPNPQETWALDNGAYSAYRRNTTPDYRRYLQRLIHLSAQIHNNRLHKPLFITAPDLLGAGKDSLRFSLEWTRTIHEQAPHLPIYLPCGDDCHATDIKRVLPHFDGLFLAGSNSYKEQARTLIALLHDERPGLPIHYARASTPKHLVHATELGCQSADTAYPLLHPPALRDFLTTWLTGHAP